MFSIFPSTEEGISTLDLSLSIVIKGSFFLVVLYTQKNFIKFYFYHINEFFVNVVQLLGKKLTKNLNVLC